MKLKFPSWGNKPAINSAPTNTTLTSLAASQQASGDKQKKLLPYTQKALSKVRQDMASHTAAINLAQSEEPKTWSLQLLLADVAGDALVTSQMENRKQPVLRRPFKLKNEKGVVDEVQTEKLKNLSAYRKLTNLKLDSIYRGYSLGELSLIPINGEITVAVTDVPRTNVVPQKGLFFPDYSDDKSTKYREMSEYGTYILEFDSGGFGLINKAVPHVLIKRFAQSCWSELCEIYGIPPRVLKTNTQDDAMLKRGEQMMSDMGAAAWLIIDESENLEWATGTQTDGAVYQNLIGLCSNEVSLLFCGAVMGQDTKNGSRSKDESAQQILLELIQADIALCEDYWNTVTLPALVELGVLSGNLRIEYEKAEDIKQLWSITKDALNYFNVDPAWAKAKFGVEITGERANVVGAGSQTDAQKLSADFFA